jgi:hypothetical protein
MIALSITAAELAQAKAYAGAGRLCRFVWTVLLAVLMADAMTGCGKSVPNPVDETKDPIHIPFGDTVFVIPKKTWLKGYSRNSTDGLVSHISLHASAPNVEPWSPSVNDQMYPRLGWGNRIEIDLSESEYKRKVTEKIVSESRQCTFVPSPLHDDPHIRFCEKENYFGYSEDGYFKYSMICRKDTSQGRFPVDMSCDIHFAHKGKYAVTVTFSSRYFKHAFDIARKTEALLLQFDQGPQTTPKPPQGDKP